MRFEEGRELLHLCLSAPYRDIVALSAWNLAEMFRVEGRLDEADALSALAVDLGNGTALRVTAQRLFDQDDVDGAIALHERAVSELPRGDLNRAASCAFLAKRHAIGLEDTYSSWYLSNVGSLPLQEWLDCATSAFWSGEFNVDVARAAIATEYFEDCPARCYYESAPCDCGDCGRGPETFLNAASGNGDGAYPAFRIAGPDDSGETEFIGVFIPFLEEDVDGLEFFGAGGQFLDIIASAAPLVLGTLTCRGELIISDASKSRDDRDVSVRLDMPEGDYVVVCWLRPDSDHMAAYLPQLAGTGQGGDPLTSVAMAAVRGPLARTLLEHSPVPDISTRDAFLGGVWGNDERQVHLLIGDIRPTVLARMMETPLDSDGDDSFNAFLLQLAEFDSGADDAIYALQSQGHVTTHALELLRRRGYVEPRLPWWQESFAIHPDDVWSQVAAARAAGPLPTTRIDGETVWTRRALARRTDLTAEMLDTLRRDLDDRVRVNLASNTSVPSELLTALADDPHPSVRGAVAANPRTTVDDLTRLAYFEVSPKGALAENDRTPSAVLVDLARGGTQAVRETVAGRSDLPAELARTLTTDSPTVRRSVASNPAAPADVLENLAKDEKYAVRAGVAGNPSTPTHVLTELSLDGEEMVRDAVMRNPASPDIAKAQASLLGSAPESDDEDEELSDLRFAANAGNLAAQYELGVWLEEDENYEEAKYWYLKAAEAGHANAQFDLGNLLMTPEWGCLDQDEAERWLLLAAGGDSDVEVYHALGMLYSSYGKNYEEEAQSWFVKYAEATE